MNRIFLAALGALLFFSPVSVQGETDTPNLVELAQSAGNFNTLITAATAAGLDEVLASGGPFTLFAPTDDAFAKLDRQTIPFLLSKQGLPELQRILKHHVVAGSFSAEMLLSGEREVETLAGTKLSLEVVRDRVFVNEALVESADLKASNGMVHVLDRVLMPPKLINPRETLLTAAIARGAAHYNEGEASACCSVYATALEAIWVGTGFGLSDKQRAELGVKLQAVQNLHNEESMAWEYRRIIDELLVQAPVIEKAGKVMVSPGNARMLFNFENSEQVSRWNTILDGVMGGRSTGTISEEDGALIFEGSTSLKNQGGFSSMRAVVAAGTFQAGDAIRIRVKGDGRTYILGTRSSSGRGGDAYWSRFETKAGEWMEITTRLEDMEHRFIGRKLEQDFDSTLSRIIPGQIKGIDFYIYDKKAGPFRLEIESVEAVKL